ncbi:MAG: cell division protein FtsQ/DivIB [Bacteroidales bacterium]|nr:cell division protein FtsQ/DivIB [Bacteroidales bacterium]
MKRKTIISLSLTALLIVYLCVALPLTHSAAANDPLTALKINVLDTAKTGFITAEDIDIELGDLSMRIKQTPRSRLNTYHLENKLKSMGKIEDAHIVILGDGTMLVDVIPMVPVARVFTDSGSYYINSAGKRINADARYHVDVPVVTGAVRTPASVTAMLPMFRFFKSRPEYDAYVSQVDVAENGDIILIPSVAGHIVNLGDTSHIADKMERLHTFYTKVMPVRGWEYYDAISLKWNGRIVATRAAKRADMPRPVTVPDTIGLDVPDLSTISLPDGPVLPPD